MTSVMLRSRRLIMMVTFAWLVMMLENEHLVQNSFPQALQFWDQKVDLSAVFTNIIWMFPLYDKWIFWIIRQTRDLYSTGCPKNNETVILSLNLFQRSDFAFSHVFRNQILSPFHLNTLNIPIQNIKCPKNTKNACADIIFSPANRTWTTLQLLLLREERGEPSGRWDTDISSAELKIRTCLYCWRWTMLSSPLASHHPSVAGFKLWNEGEMMGETHGSTFHALKKK